jgi:hypothetical protein
MTDRLFDVWVPENGDDRGDKKPVLAYSPQSAAERFAARDDAWSADYTFAHGCDDEVHVAESGMDDVTIFTIHAETCPTYYATEKR